MLTIEQAKERWRELLGEFKDLRARAPVAVFGTGMTIRITRRNDRLVWCTGMSREFCTLASSAARLLQQSPVSIETPEHVKPEDAWCSLLAQDSTTDVSIITGTESDPYGPETEVVFGSYIISDAVGLSCTIAREILAELEEAADDLPAPVDAGPQPAQVPETDAEEADQQTTVPRMLIGWPDILAEIHLQQKQKVFVESLNKKTNGPIRTKKGGKPTVDAGKLAEWWTNLMQDDEDRREQESVDRENLESQTGGSATWNYGKTGSVVDGIGGVKNRRSDKKPGN